MIPAQLWRRIVTTGFHLLYHQFAWSYDAVSWLVSLGAWRRWQLCALDYVQGAEVLEIGHGPGHLLLALSSAGYAVSGVDKSPQMGRLAQPRLLSAGYPARLMRCEAQGLPLATDSFDTVVATFPSEYIVAVQTLGQIRRVLRPGGRLIILPEAQLTGRSPVVRILELLYAITGQRAAADTAFVASDKGRWVLLCQHLETLGFACRIEHVTFTGRRVHLIIADLP